MAIFLSRDQILKHILQHKSMQHISASGRRAALKNAAFNGQTWVVQELLKADYAWAKTPGLLSAAAGSGSFELVDMLLAHGADINDEAVYCTSILQACFMGRREMVRHLLDLGAKVPTVGSVADATLHAAARGGIEFVAEELLNAGLETECMPPEAIGTALDTAVYMQHSRVVRLLLDSHAKLDSRGLLLEDLYFKLSEVEPAAAVAQLRLASGSEAKWSGPGIQLAALSGDATNMTMLLD